MKSLMTLFFCLCASGVFALDYHPATELPNPDQLFMWVEVIPGKLRHERQTIYISHFREHEHLSKIQMWNWMTFDTSDLEQMLSEGTPIHYLP